MKTLQLSSGGTNYSAIDLGELVNLTEYSFLHPKLKSEIKGKVYTGEFIKSTGTEISFQILPPKTDIPFLHQHKDHEEVYIFLKGTGQFMVDGSVFDVKEGSVVRISPEGKRTWRNNSDFPMIFICIQSRQNSIENYSVYDGFRAQGEISWDKK